MRKLSAFILFVAVLGLTTVSAQKSKITSGVLDFDQGRYEEAVESLEEGLSHPEMFKKTRDMAKGYFYLAKAYYSLLGNDDLAEKYPDAALKAKKAFDQMQATPDGAMYQNRAILENLSENIWGQVYNKGVNLFNSNEDDDALTYFIAAQELNPEHFLTNRMLASAYLVKADTANTVELLSKAISVYKSKYIDTDQAQLATMMEDEGFSQIADLDKSQLSYVVRQLAVIHEGQGKTEEALSVLEDGAKLLPEDEDVRRQELSIYQAHPDLFERATAKFEAQMESNPEDNAIRLAYASMLERAGKNDEALALYQKAYDQDNENLQANYGLAAIRINMAAELSEKRTQTNNDNEIDQYNEQIKTLCSEAYPYLVWLHNAQPNEPEWVSQLVNVTPIIGKTEEMMQWAEKLGKMRRGEN
ncbi:MAG: tetratricopeptide repeat protein [Bacteroidia bacterium]|nr:tetratricopeptide repeat protein [Bacteroidia bacterium]